MAGTPEKAKVGVAAGRRVRHLSKEGLKPVFVAWRDLRFAKGRFALMGAVIVLITVLVGLVSGLTAGLAEDSTSAITGLPADHLVFSAPADGEGPSFTASRFEDETWTAWAQVPGVAAADPLGITATRATADEQTASVSAFGVEPGSRLAPSTGQLRDGTVVLSTGAADDLHAQPGDTVTPGRPPAAGGRRLR